MRQFIDPTKWTPEARGRALHMVYVLAITPPDEWRSKQELHDALAEFRIPAAIPPAGTEE